MKKFSLEVDEIEAMNIIAGLQDFILQSQQCINSNDVKTVQYAKYLIQSFQDTLTKIVKETGIDPFLINAKGAKLYVNHKGKIKKK